LRELNKGSLTKTLENPNHKIMTKNLMESPVNMHCRIRSNPVSSLSTNKSLRLVCLSVLYCMPNVAAFNVPSGSRRSVCFRLDENVLVSVDSRASWTRRAKGKRMDDEDDVEKNNDQTNDKSAGRSSRRKSKQDDDITITPPNWNMTESTSKVLASPKERLESALRQKRAKAELNRLTHSPDAPFDVAGSLAALKPKDSPSSGIPSPLSRYMMDHEARVQHLESQMLALCRQNSYLEATKLRDELHRLHLEDCGFVLQANHAFYKAMSAKSYEDMLEIWHADDTIECIFPSHPPLIGYEAVLGSFKETFYAISKLANSPSPSTVKSTQTMYSSLHANTVEPQNVRLSIKGNTAHVTCEEHVYGTTFKRGVGRKRELIKKFVATNVFRKVCTEEADIKWKMVHHHGSWHVDYDILAQKIYKDTNTDKSSKARLYDSRFRQTDSFEQVNSLSFRSGKEKSPIGDAVSKIVFGHSSLLTQDKDKKKSSGAGSSISSLEKLLGLGGSTSNSDFGGLGSGSASGQEGKSVRIFKGSLSDLLKSGLVGGTDDDEDEADDEEEFVDLEDEQDEFYMENLEDEDDEDEETTTQAIIHINPIFEDDKSSVKRENSSNSTSTTKSTSENDTSNSRNKQLDSTKSKKFSMEEGGAKYKDELRQNCISALRRLCDQGSISQKQKRVLLTDIITCSARGEFSMVEVAFELLCGESGEDEIDEAEEEFADQCRVFANELLNSAAST